MVGPLKLSGFWSGPVCGFAMRRSASRATVPPARGHAACKEANPASKLGREEKWQQFPCCCPVMTWTAASPARCMRMAAAAGLYGSSSGAVATRPVGTVKVLAPRVAKPSTTCSDERSQRSAEHVAALDRGGVCKLLADQWWVGQPCHPPRTSPSGCGECSQAIGDGCKRYYEDPKSPYPTP